MSRGPKSSQPVTAITGDHDVKEHVPDRAPARDVERLGQLGLEPDARGDDRDKSGKAQDRERRRRAIQATASSSAPKPTSSFDLVVRNANVFAARPG